MQRQIIVFFLSVVLLALQSAWGADRGALFKVSGDGHALYLFGTMHAGQAAFYPLEPRIEAALADASTLALEVDPLGDPALMAAAVQAQGMLAAGELDYTARAPAFRARLERVAAKAGIDLAPVARLKPWLLATLLVLKDYVALGYDPAMAVDLRLSQMAHSKNVPVIELESISKQLAMFDRLSGEQQWLFLEESVAMMESGKQRTEARQVAEAWARADKTALDAVAARIEADTSVGGRFMQKVMLEERNGPMADKIAQLLARQDKAVVAVGVLHLIGKHGIPAQLSARGLKVERIY